MCINFRYVSLVLFFTLSLGWHIRRNIVRRFTNNRYIEIYLNAFSTSIIHAEKLDVESCLENQKKKHNNNNAYVWRANKSYIIGNRCKFLCFYPVFFLFILFNELDLNHMKYVHFRLMRHDLCECDMQNEVLCERKTLTIIINLVVSPQSVKTCWN